jgi:hypothetical protein
MFTLNLNIHDLRIAKVDPNEEKPSSIDRSMVCYTQGYFLYGTESAIYYMEVQNLLDSYYGSHEYVRDHIENFAEGHEENPIIKFSVESNYRFRGFVDAGDNFAAMLMEEKTNHTLDFIRLVEINGNSEQSIILAQCGITNDELSKKSR